MGQRLVIEIYNGDKELANCYYHWSGYTLSSYEISKEALDYYINNLKNKTFFEDNNKDLTYKAVKMLLETGAGLQSEEVEPFNKMFPNLNKEMQIGESENRNKGLICITEEEMEDSSSWSEGTVSIDLKSETISFGSICELPYKEWYDDEASWNIDILEEGQPSLSKEEIEKEIQKVNKLREEDLIKESTKSFIIETLKKGNAIFKDAKEPFIINDGIIDLSNISFKNYYLLGEVLNNTYNAGYYNFMFADDESETVYCMIE